MPFLNRCIWAAANPGTASFVVSAAAQNGYTPTQCLSPVVVDGATYHYFAVNDAQHEEGDGVWNSTTSTLTRATIRNSSNSDAVVNFTAIPTVFMGGPTATDLREVLTANRTYFVRTDGSDSHNGLANTAASAFLTGQHAWNVICETLDLNKFVVTIQFGTGSFTGTITDYYASTTTGAEAQAYVGGGYVKILGNGAASTTLTTTGAVWTVWLTSCYVFVDNLTIAGTFTAAWDGVIEFGSGVKFGTSTAEHLHASSGGQIRCTGGSYTISGGATIHAYAGSGGQVRTQTCAITVSGTPAFSSAFAYCDPGGRLDFANATITGSATGQRFYGGGIFLTGTNASDISFFPGNSAGVLLSPGAQYDGLGSERFGVDLSNGGAIPVASTFTLVVPIWAKKVIFGAALTSDTASRRPKMRISVDGGSTYISTGYYCIGANAAGVMQAGTDCLMDMFTTVAAARFYNIVCEIVTPIGAAPKANFFGFTDDLSAGLVGGSGYIGMSAGQRITNLQILLDGSGNFDGFGYNYVGFG